MTSLSRYLVVYKDAPDSVIKYFGPFVSFTFADEFAADLPTPLKGGVVAVRPIQQSHDNDFCRALILRQRQERTSNLHTTHRVVA